MTSIAVSTAHTGTALSRASAPVVSAPSVASSVSAFPVSVAPKATVWPVGVPAGPTVRLRQAGFGSPLSTSDNHMNDLTGPRPQGAPV